MRVDMPESIPFVELVRFASRHGCSVTFAGDERCELRLAPINAAKLELAKRSLDQLRDVGVA